MATHDQHHIVVQFLDNSKDPATLKAELRRMIRKDSLGCYIKSDKSIGPGFMDRDDVMRAVELKIATRDYVPEDAFGIIEFINFEPWAMEIINNILSPAKL